MDFSSNKEDSWKNIKRVENDQHLEMTILYELAWHMGFNSQIPRVIFVGQQSAGKSSMVEMILNFKKVSHSSDDRATLCPVIYSVKRQATSKDDDQTSEVIQSDSGFQDHTREKELF
mmetsp:Transcript_56072/g.122045  ORF Transcript_56072/g.122045 Transcript_56072/m.122045 type:complete len:117 (+) Transcript_56072:96-446(+)